MQRLKVAVVGLNFGRTFIREHLMRGIALHYCELAAVCDLEQDISKAVGLTYGVPAYTNLDDLLSDSNIPVIILLTGPSGRADLLHKIIESGKDCITTKPFELDAEKAAVVLEKARLCGRIIHLNSPSIQDTKDYEWIAHWRKKYDLGQAVGGHYESWYKCVESADGNWYDDAMICPSAPTLRLGIYGINDLLRILGEPKEIQIMQSRLFTGRPTADWARLGIKFKSGAIADTLTGFTTSPERHESSLILYFERGTIYRNPPMLPGSAVRNRLIDATYLCLCMGDDSDGMPLESVRIKNIDLSLGYKWEAFYHAVTQRDLSRMQTLDTVIIQSIQILASIGEAVRTGKTIQVGQQRVSRK
jgi:predicted dehydrogenase